MVHAQAPTQHCYFIVKHRSAGLSERLKHSEDLFGLVGFPDAKEGIWPRVRLKTVLSPSLSVTDNLRVQTLPMKTV